MNLLLYVHDMYMHKKQQCLAFCKGYNFQNFNNHYPIHLYLSKSIFSIYLIFIEFLNVSAAATAAKSLQSCPTLCDPIDGSPPGSSLPGILQTRILEQAAISFSNARMHAKSLQSCLNLCYPMDSSPPGFSVHGDSPGKNTGVGCHFLLSVIFHLQLLQNIGYIPCVVQYVTELILHTLFCTSHLPYPYVAYPPLHPHWQPLISSLYR